MILARYSYLLAGLIPQAQVKIYPDSAQGFLFSITPSSPPTSRHSLPLPARPPVPTATRPLFSLSSRGRGWCSGSCSCRNAGVLASIILMGTVVWFWVAPLDLSPSVLS